MTRVLLQCMNANRGYEISIVLGSNTFTVKRRMRGTLRETILMTFHKYEEARNFAEEQARILNDGVLSPVTVRA